MPKYNVTFNWDKYIAFPPIEAKSKNEAIKKAEEMLAESDDLIEEDGNTKWVAKKFSDN